MYGNLVHIQDAHGTHVQLTQERLVYGEEVVDVSDITGVRMEPYGADSEKSNLTRVQISRRTESTLNIEDLSRGDANELRGCANREAPALGWELSERLNGLRIAHRCMRYSPIGASS